MEAKDKKTGAFAALLDDKGNPVKQAASFEPVTTPPVQTKPPRPHPITQIVVVVLFIVLCVGAVAYRVGQHYANKKKPHALPASMRMIVVDEKR